MSNVSPGQQVDPVLVINQLEQEINNFIFDENQLRDELMRSLEREFSRNFIDFNLEEFKDYESLNNTNFVEKLRNYIEKYRSDLDLRQIEFLINKYENKVKIKVYLGKLFEYAGAYFDKVTSMDKELKDNTEILQQHTQRIENFSTLVLGLQNQLQGNEDRIAERVKGGLSQDISDLNGKLGTLEGRIPQDFAAQLETNISNRVQIDLGQRLATIEGRLPQDFVTQLETNIANRVRISLPPNLIGRKEFWIGIILTIVALFLSAFGLTGFGWFMLNSSIDRAISSNKESIDEAKNNNKELLEEKFKSSDQKFLQIEKQLQRIEANQQQK